MPTNNLQEAPRCLHIKTTGERCRSPRLRDNDFCYFHHRMHAEHRTAVVGSTSAEVMVPVLDKHGSLTGMEPAPRQSISLGLLEDRASVQIAISTVLNALASGHLEQRRATALLYGLQLASANCSREGKPPIFQYFVTDMQTSPEGLPLAYDDEAHTVRV